jgi:predicted RNA binding protein YcfA (HicA-like mRNA interferase family)
MPISSKEIIAALLAAGWYEARQKGSHVHFKHPEKPDRVTVVHPLKDTKLGTLMDIERKSGLRFRK